VNVEALMNPNVHTCRPADLLSVPARLMWERDIGAVPVVDASGVPVGMVTDRDICMSAYTTGKRLEEQRVEAAMSRTVFTVLTNEPVERADALMRERQVRRVPVVDDRGRLVGILSLNDMARASARERSVRPEQLTATLASICQPRQGARA
jgi:CBS domain-containing protein